MTDLLTDLLVDLIGGVDGAINSAFNSLMNTCFNAEYELIHPHLNDPHCLNIKEGGIGIPHLNTRNKISETLKNKQWTLEHYRHLCECNKGKNKNKPCSDYQKKQLSEYNKGMKVLCKDGYRVRVKGDDIEYYLSRGYHIGMK